MNLRLMPLTTGAFVVVDAVAVMPLLATTLPAASGIGLRGIRYVGFEVQNWKYTRGYSEHNHR